MTEQQVAALEVARKQQQQQQQQQQQSELIAQQQDALQQFKRREEEVQAVAQQQQQQQAGLVGAEVNLGAQLLAPPPPAPTPLSHSLLTPNLPSLTISLGDVPPLPPFSDAMMAMPPSLPFQQQQQSAMSFALGASPLMPPSSAPSGASLAEGGFFMSGLSPGLDFLGSFGGTSCGFGGPSALTLQRSAAETPIPLSEPLPPQQSMFQPQHVSLAGAPRPQTTEVVPQSMAPTMMSAQVVTAGVGEGGQGNTAEAARHFEAAIKLIFGNKATQEVSMQLSSWLTAVAAGMASPQGHPSTTLGLNTQQQQQQIPVNVATEPALKAFRPEAMHTVPLQPGTTATMGLQAAPPLPSAASSMDMWGWYNINNSNSSNNSHILPVPVSLPILQSLQQSAPPSYTPVMMQPPPLPSSMSSSMPGPAPSSLLPSFQYPSPQQESTTTTVEGGLHEIGRPTVCHICGHPYDAMHIKKYVRCRRICNSCRTAVTVIKNGLSMRFCQLCSWVHPLSHFDDGRKSCRRELRKHNERRRKRVEQKKDGAGVLVGGCSTETETVIPFGGSDPSSALTLGMGSLSPSPACSTLFSTGTPPLTTPAVFPASLHSITPVSNGVPPPL